MRQVQKGFLLKRLDYSETSLILHFFTLENGFQAYLFQGGKKKKGNFLQPLSYVEISSYRRPDSELGKITEINPVFVPQTLPFDPIKSGLIFFMTEVLGQILQKEHQDSRLFAFIEQELYWLDSSEELTNYPIWFLVTLAEFLGLAIQIESVSGLIFNLEEGTISNQPPKSPQHVKGEVVEVLKEVLQNNKNHVLALSISKNLRRELVHQLIDYYRVHIQGFKPTKSLEVMQVVFG